MLITWMAVACCPLFMAVVALLFIVYRRKSEAEAYKSEAETYKVRFSSIIDTDNELKRLKKEREQYLTQEVERRNTIVAEHEKELVRLKAEREEYLAKDEALRKAAITNSERELARVERDLDERVALRKAELATIAAEHEQLLTRQAKEAAHFAEQDQSRRALLTKEYDEALATYQRLKEQLSLLEQNTEDLSFGLYQPQFDFATPEHYKAKLIELREEEKRLVRAGLATGCLLKWTVGNSQREGQRMVKLYSKLMLRAFNGECDAALADITWSNATKMEERITSAFTSINQLGGVLSVSLTYDYRDLKLNELRLKHEYEQKRYEEREEQRRIREQIREEERAEREIEKAREEAETEEARYQKALDQAQKEAAKATGEQLQKLTERVGLFEAKLDEARRKKERAISRAQMTKSGFVYIISNIGSFGDRVYKIGMTRRMEPMERIYELSGASVPFPYDLHAMLYSDNAPELECALHRLFHERRLNLANPRREFYKDVELHEIQQYVTDKGLSAQFIATPEAREYRETLALRQQLASSQPKPEQVPEFQDQLFV